jgi:Tol biopolymer transport system component
MDSLYTEGSGNYVALNIAPVRGGPARQIASNLSIVCPAWSPDGRNIEFTGYTKGEGQPYLFVLNVRTRRLRRLAGSMQLLTPAWSLDSKKSPSPPGPPPSCLRPRRAAAPSKSSPESP